MRKKLRRLNQRYLKDSDTRSRTLYRAARHPVIIPILTFFGLVLVTIGGFLVFNGGRTEFKPISSYIVIISHDHEVVTVPTNEPTVGDLLNKLHITLSKNDVVEPSLSTAINQDNFRVNVYRAVPVEVVDGTNTTYGFSAATTARSIAEQAGVTVYPEDYVNVVPTSNFLAQGAIGEQVIINRATPVNVNLYGTPTVIRTHTTTVGAMLAEKHIVLGSNDSVQPSQDTPLVANAQVFLIHKGTQIVNVTQSIPAPIQTVLDNSLTFGTTAVRQAGSAGTEVLTYQQNTQNGKVVSQTLIQTVVTQQPVTQIIAQGRAVQIPSDISAVMSQAGISQSDYPYVNYIVSNESGWCPTKLQGEVGYCPGYAPAGGVPSYGGYGLGQATPGSKMAPFGSDWETNPVTQLRWATSYADGRYGSWAAAYNHWYNYHNW